MARLIRNSKLDTRSARSALKVRREPYWIVLSKGCALGYRRLGVARGSWIARYRGEDGKRAYEALGAADDAMDADGAAALSFQQAQERARKFFSAKGRELSGDAVFDDAYTVCQALEDYFVDRERSGAKNVANERLSVNAVVLPALGDVRVAKLTRKKLKDWLHNVAATPARIRSSANCEQRYRPAEMTEEQIRQRRTTANRVWATVRGALNFAASQHPDLSDAAWRRVPAFKNVSRARVRFLSDEEARRLVDAAEPAFRNLVVAGLLTGARYGELGRLVAEDFHDNAGTLEIRFGKTKPSRRHIVLNEEGQEFFRQLRRGKEAAALLLTMEGGHPWNKSCQTRPMRETCQAAKIARANFHALRHTYASRLVMKSVPLTVVAAQLGHSSIKMVEKHYGHLAPNYVADTVRAAMTTIGVVKTDNLEDVRT